MTITDAQAEVIRNALLTVAAMVSPNRPWTFQERRIWGMAYNIVSGEKSTANSPQEKGKPQ